MSEATSPGLAIEALREDLRQSVRRKLDLAVTLGAAGASTLQAIQLGHHGGSSGALAALAASLVLVVCGVLGLSGRARWTPVIYVTMIVIANAVYLTSYGPLVGLGAVYLSAITMAFMFLTKSSRWLVVLVLSATPLVVGASFALGAGQPPVVHFADLATWTRTSIVAVAALGTVALIVGYCVRQLVVARRTLQLAHEAEQVAQLEQLRIGREISRTRRADLIVELAAAVGADIGAQLRGITTHAESLARELTDEEAQACLAEVIEVAAAAASTMRSFTLFGSDVASPDAGSDAARAARELPRIVRRLIPTRISLVISADDDAWVPITATDLARILSNLVLNARDAILDRGVIEVRVTRTGSVVEVEVRDNGAGMDEAIRAAVFQPFFTTKPVGRGTGLGLATTKILVERAGGTLEFVSQPGVGTCFTIRLPFLPRPVAPSLAPPVEARPS